MAAERTANYDLRSDLFTLAGAPAAELVHIGGMIPAVIVDEFYAEPDRIRDAVLRLQYEPHSYGYPGRIAKLPTDNPSLTRAVDWIRAMVNRLFLPVAPLTCNGKLIESFDRIVTDMALTDTHPDALSDGQRLPHVDPVPVFGLVYLNRETRGGTLFFQQDPNVPQDTSRSGYPVADMPGFRLLGRLGGTFNRLVIYPGIVPHSGEIAGDWIEGEERNAYPRLTQRFTFFPSP